MRSVAVAVGSAVALAASVAGLENGYGFTPGMGFDLDYGNPRAPGPGRGNASYILGIADFFTSPSNNSYPSGKSPQELGYWFIETDSDWDLPTRSASGNLQPDPEKYPDGIEAVVNKLHSMGLKFGLYGDRGNLDCNRNPGQLGHEKQDAAFFASLNIDWFKEDSCYDSADQATAFAHYRAMRDALNATGHKMWFALCGWEPWYGPPNPALNYTGGMNMGNSWRVGPDTGSGWQAVLTNVANAVSVARYAGPSVNGGGWNDGSLLLNPGMGCPGTACQSSQQCSSGQVCQNGECSGGKTDPETCMSSERSTSMFSLWCVLALNLVMTGNLPLIEQVQPSVIQTWLNAEAIAVDQDPTWNGTAGLYARRLDNYSAVAAGGLRGLEPGHTAECGGEPADQNWTFGVPADGYVRNAATALCLSIADCATEIAYDSCETDPNRVTCAGKGRYPHFQWDFDATTGLLASRVRPNTCAAVTSADGDMSAVTCDASDPRQQFQYSPQQQITNQGHCLTADPPVPPGPQTQTAIYGRPLADGAWAIVMLNDTPDNTTMSCDSACTAAMGFHASAMLQVRDLIAHADLPAVSAGTGVSAHVQGNGASVFYKLIP